MQLQGRQLTSDVSPLQKHKVSISLRYASFTSSMPRFCCEILLSLLLLIAHHKRKIFLQTLCIRQTLPVRRVGGKHMKATALIKSFLFALVLSGVVAVSANAMMNEFKIADLNLDGQPEIVLADSRNLYVLDQDGKILTSKSLSEIYNSDNGSGANTTTTIHGMGGGSIQIEIANMDDTPNPEIVVRYFNKLLVLDENLELKKTITLPVKTSYPF